MESEAFRYLIKTFKKVMGLIPLEGLPEDWHNEKAGTYTSDGNVQKLKEESYCDRFEDSSSFSKKDQRLR